MSSTRDKIISAVIDYIKDDTNIESITLSKIAQTANIGKSTVYEHFSSKEQLIIETYQYLLDYYQKLINQPLKSNTFKSMFIEQLDLILCAMMDARTMVDAIMNHQNTFINIGKELEPCVMEIQKMMESRFLVIFKKGIEEGIIATREPKPYQGNIVQAIISGLLYQYANHTIDINKDKLYELIYDHVIMLMK